MTVFVVLFLAFTALLAFLMCCDVPDSKPKNHNTTSAKTTTHSTQNDYYDNYPNYAQQNMQRIMWEDAQRMHNRAVEDGQRMHDQAVRDAQQAHQAAVDMHNHSMDFGCGGFGPFF